MKNLKRLGAILVMIAILLASVVSVAWADEEEVAAPVVEAPEQKSEEAPAPEAPEQKSEEAPAEGGNDSSNSSEEVVEEVVAAVEGEGEDLEDLANVGTPGQEKWWQKAKTVGSKVEKVGFNDSLEGKGKNPFKTHEQQAFNENLKWTYIPGNASATMEDFEAWSAKIDEIKAPRRQ